MSFIWPQLLWLLLLLPLFVGLYVLVQRRRRKLAERYGSWGLTTRSPGPWRHVPPLIFLAGLAVLLVSLARPQMVVSLPRETGTVILAFDVSGSMAADDIKPTRMEAAKAAARDFVQRQPLTVQVGVVAFSDAGYSVQVPTNDRDAVLAAISRLTPQRGTSLASGILASLKTIAALTAPAPKVYSNLTPTPMASPTPVPKGTYTPAVMILLSDGENNENPDPLAVAQTAADRGVRIYTVGLGSAAGTILHVNGVTVHTQLDEATLQQISQLTGGVYYNADNEKDLLAIYDHLDPQLTIKPEETELTALFAGAALLVFLIGGILTLLWFGRLP